MNRKIYKAYDPKIKHIIQEVIHANAIQLMLTTEFCKFHDFVVHNLIFPLNVAYDS